MSSEMEKGFLEEVMKIHEQNNSYGILPKANYNALLNEVKVAASSKRKSNREYYLLTK
jgi:hypothetical protein